MGERGKQQQHLTDFRSVAAFLTLGPHSTIDDNQPPQPAAAAAGQQLPAPHSFCRCDPSPALSLSLSLSVLATAADAHQQQPGSARWSASSLHCTRCSQPVLSVRPSIRLPVRLSVCLSVSVSLPAFSSLSASLSVSLCDVAVSLWAECPFLLSVLSCLCSRSLFL